jgi:RNA-binding protein Musashi
MIFEAFPDSFLLRYDADENTNQTSSAPKISDSTVSLAPPQATTFPATQAAENFKSEPEDAHATDSYAYSYEGHQRNGSGMYDTNHTTIVTAAPTTEQEPQGTGIKEDG